MVALADRAMAILREACRAAEDMDLNIAMENHTDFTVRELVGILVRVGSPAFGFTADCGNLAFDLDHPLRLAEIMAPYALTTPYKNHRVLRTPQGIAMGNCALEGMKGGGSRLSPPFRSPGIDIRNFRPADQVDILLVRLQLRWYSAQLLHPTGRVRGRQGR